MVNIAYKYEQNEVGKGIISRIKKEYPKSMHFIYFL